MSTKNIGLKEYVESFKTDSDAARSLNISPQRLYFNMLKHKDYFVQISTYEKKLCRIISITEV